MGGALAMTTINKTHQTNAMSDQLDGVAGAPAPSQRDLRAMRRGRGLPVLESPHNQELLTQGRRLSKRKMGSDDEFDEVCRSAKHFPKYT